MSLQIGDEIGRTSQPIIDPKQLKIIAYSLDGPLLNNQDENTLMTEDIRELGQIGMIVDSSDTLVNPDDVIKVAETLKLNFSLIGLKVETKKGQHIGKVIDYTVDSSAFSVYQLIVKRPFLQGLNDPELTINRSQIVEIDDYKVIIKHDTETVKIEPLESDASFAPNYINPFRKNQVPAPAENSTIE